MEPEGTAAIVTEGTVVVTVIVTLSVSETGTAQKASEIRITLITLPFARAELEYVLLVCPAMAIPLFIHWYWGLAPPLAMTVVNVARSPPQMESLGLAVKVTLGMTEGFTVIVTASVSVRGAAQRSLEVITTLTMSPLDSVEMAKGFPEVDKTPFTNH